MYNKISNFHSKSNAAKRGDIPLWSTKVSQILHFFFTFRVKFLLKKKALKLFPTAYKTTPIFYP